MKSIKAKQSMGRLHPITRVRSSKKCMHYLVEWEGEQWVGHDTWEPLDRLQAPRVKALVNAFNAVNKR